MRKTITPTDIRNPILEFPNKSDKVKNKDRKRRKKNKLIIIIDSGGILKKINPKLNHRIRVNKNVGKNFLDLLFLCCIFPF